MTGLHIPTAMSHSTSGSVECPLCGETFDPSAAGGWCTNSDCGEWQYEDVADTIDDDDRDRDAVGDATVDDDTAADGDDAVDDVREHSSADADASPGDVDELSDEGDAEAEGEVEAAAVETDAADEASGDVEPEPDAEREAEGEQGIETGTGSDSAPGEAAVDEADSESAGATDQSAGVGERSGDDPELACPSCGDAVEAEDNFCANCGEDVSSLEPGPLTECPSCEAEVGAEDNFCANCGEELSQYRPGANDAEETTDDAEETTDDAEETTDDEAANGAGEVTADSADESATDGEEAAGAGGESTDESAATGEGADRRVTEAAPVDESLTLVVRNHEIEVWDGDVVGREVRKVIMETGGDEDDAVRVHREHVQFEYEDGGFALVALGQNPTVVNGERVEQGERVPVSPGDRIELSKVAKMRVREP